MRDQYDGSRIPDQFTPVGTFVIMAILIGALFVVISVGVSVRKNRFESCEQARQAGVVLPLTPDAPGWNPELDVDRDGRAC